MEAEIDQFYRYYSIISDELDLAMTEEQRKQTARDRACNMANYVPYPGIHEVLETLGKTHRLGIISDTWPSIVPFMIGLPELPPVMSLVERKQTTSSPLSSA